MRAVALKTFRTKYTAFASVQTIVAFPYAIHAFISANNSYLSTQIIELNGLLFKSAKVVKRG